MWHGALEERGRRADQPWAPSRELAGKARTERSLDRQCRGQATGARGEQTRRAEWTGQAVRALTQARRAAEAALREGGRGPARARRPEARNAGTSRPMREGVSLPEEWGRAHTLPTGPYPSHLQHRMGWGDLHRQPTQNSLMTED